MSRCLTLVIGVFVFLFAAAPSRAAFVDFSTVTVSGTNPYTFTLADLGDVTATYSGLRHPTAEGKIATFGGISSLGVSEGDGSTGPSIFTLTWTKPITELAVRHYDMDLSEKATYNLPAGVNIALISDNPLDGGDSLAGNDLIAGVGAITNSAANNFAALNLSGSPFTTFQITFSRPGASGGASSIVFGDAVLANTSAVVPVPATAWLGLVGFGALWLRGERGRGSF
jgi:hypothetical protein